MTDNLNNLNGSSLIIFNLIYIYLASDYKGEIIHIVANVHKCFVCFVFTIIYAASVSYRPETEIF